MNYLDLKAMNKKLSIIIIFFGALFLYGCPGNHCVQPRYEFDLEFNFSHSHTDTVMIGDTVWVYATFSDQIFDKISQTIVNYPDGQFCINIGPRKFQKSDVFNERVIDGHPFFDIITAEGSKKGNGFCILIPDYNMGYYSFKEGYVCKEAGVYYVDHFIYSTFQKDKKNHCEGVALTKSKFTGENNFLKYAEYFGLSKEDFPDYPGKRAFVVVPKQ
jgi:hypothetical protein